MLAGEMGYSGMGGVNMLVLTEIPQEMLPRGLVLGPNAYRVLIFILSSVFSLSHICKHFMIKNL